MTVCIDLRTSVFLIPICRNFNRSVFTSASFNMKRLKELYFDLSDEEKNVLTDACKICVVRGLPVFMVRGEVSNLKITTVSDYKIAQAMVGGIAID